MPIQDTTILATSTCVRFDYWWLVGWSVLRTNLFLEKIQEVEGVNIQTKACIQMDKHYPAPPTATQR